MKQPQDDKNPFELIEEGFHLLRSAPTAALATYYLGALPFVLGLLFFWSDMSRGVFAEQRLTAGACVLSLLFLWMKGWQAVFAQHLLGRLCREPARRWNFRRWLRIAFVQAVLQPSGLFLLPLCIIVLLPFGWVYAFYQNVTALGGGEDLDLGSVFKKAWQQSRLWPMQNHSVLFLFKAFGFFVLLNLITAVMTAPFLLKTLFGVETVFSQSPLAMLNSTFFAAIFGLTYLCIDPVLKAVYVLRCFYGESLRTGQDLKAELKVFLTVPRAAALLLCLGLLHGETLLAAAPDQGEAPRASRNPGPQTVSPPNLDRAIEDVIQQREYIWRMPREKAKTQHEKGTIAAFIDGIFETIGGWFKAAGRWIRDVMQWLRKFFRPQRADPGAGRDWSGTLRGLLFVLTVVLACVLAVLLIRIWRSRAREPEEVLAEAILPAPDIRDENVGADQLPEDGWLKLARELVEKGELRLALRAFYLASLAHLAGRNLITIARFKSNCDYDRELRRRAHALPEVSNVFSENVSVFDRIWYGLHEVTRERVQNFAANVERIKGRG